MKLKLLILLLFIISLVSDYSLCQERGDHLVPVEDVFNLHEWEAEYFSNIRSLLFAQGLSQARIRILSLPAFGKERSIEVSWDRSENLGHIIKRIAKERIWQHENPENISVDEHISKITRSDYDLLFDLFLKSVNETRYHEEGWIGLDGYTVYFMVWDTGWKSGQTWSPKDGTKMKGLIDIYLELSKQAGQENWHFEISDSLARQIVNLKKEFE